jgi:hypothetical protein
MIPVPQPRSRAQSDGESATPGSPSLGPPTPTVTQPSARAQRPGRGRRTLIVVGIVVAAIVVIVVIGITVGVIEFGINPWLVVLVAAVVVCGGLSALVRFFPQSLPGLSLLRYLLGFASLAAIAAILYLFVYPALQGQGTSLGEFSNPGMHAAAPAQAAPATVVFEVTGTAPNASISLSPASGENASAVGAPVEHSLPFSQTITTNATESTFYILNASTSDVPDDATVTCTITVNGTVVSTDSDSGSFGSALCSGRLAGN